MTTAAPTTPTFKPFQRQSASDIPGIENLSDEERLTIDVVAHMEAYPLYDEAGKQVGKRWGMTEVWFDPVRKARTTFS